MIIVASVFLKFRNAPEIIGECVMAKTDKEIAYALKEIIDKNGPEYLTDAPFQVFKELIASAGIDKNSRCHPAFSGEQPAWRCQFGQRF